MKEDVMKIKTKVNLDQFIAIGHYLEGNTSKEDCDFLASFLKDVHDEVYNKAAMLEILGNKFIDK